MTDNNDDDIYENIENDADLPPETQGALAWAMLQFNCKFSEYIKEMNPELWKKAVDYAVTFTSVDGITFEYVKSDVGEDVIANIDIEVDEDENEEDYDEGTDNEWKDLEDDAD